MSVRTYRNDPVATEWMQLGNQALSLGSMMNQNRRLNEDAERRKQEDLYKQQVEQGLGVLRNTQEGQQPQFPEGLGARAQNEAESLHWRAKAEEMTLQGLGAQRDEEEQKKRIQEWLPKLQQTVGNDVSKLESMPFTGGVEEYMARRKYLADMASTAEGQKKIMENRLPVINQHYQDFRRGMQELDTMQARGDRNGMVSGMRALTQSLPLPYRLGAYDANTDAFVVEHLDASKGEWTQGDKVGREQALQELRGTGAEKFFVAANTHMETVRRQNAAATEFYAKGKDGQNVRVIPQINVHRPDQVDHLVIDGNGREQIFRSRAELLKAGYTVEDLDREKALKGPEGQPGLTLKQHSDMVRNSYNDAHRQVKDWYSRLPQDPDGKRRDPASGQIITEQNFQQMVEAQARQNYSLYMGGGSFPQGLGGGGGGDRGAGGGGTLEDLDPGAAERAKREKARQAREEEAAKKEAGRKAVEAKTESIRKGIRENRLPEGMTWQQFIPHVLNRTGTPPAWVPEEEMAQFRANNRRQEKPMPVVEWFKNSGWTPEYGLGGPRPSQMR